MWAGRVIFGRDLALNQLSRELTAAVGRRSSLSNNNTLRVLYGTVLKIFLQSWRPIMEAKRETNRGGLREALS